MIKLEEFKQILLYRPFIDMRLSVAGLTGIVSAELGLSPFDKTLYIFTNKRRKLVKLFYWDKNGFAIWYKKLEKDHFAWPKEWSDVNAAITAEQLKWLLNGVEFWKLKSHQEIFYSNT